MLNSHLSQFFELATVVLLLGGLAFLLSFKRKPSGKFISDLPLSKIESAPQGHVAVEGFAWPMSENTIKSVQGEDVIFQDFEIQCYRRTTDAEEGGKQWVTVFSREFKKPFYILDATGLAVVNPRDVKIEIHGSRIQDWRELAVDQKNRVLNEILTEEIPNFPPSDGLVGKMFAKNFRIVERELRLGTPLYISGNFRSSGVARVKSDIGLFNFAEIVLDRTKRVMRDSQNVLGLNKKSSSEEINAAYSSIAQRSVSKSLAENSHQDEFVVYGEFEQHEDNRLYIVDDHQTRIAEKHKAADRGLKIIGFVILLVAALAVWVNSRAN